MSIEDHLQRVGVGGPVGSGKTALIEALVPRADRAAATSRRSSPTTSTPRRTPSTCAARWTACSTPARVVGVETGACPHTAVRDDPTMNLAAGAEMLDAFPDVDTLLYESGGDNLTLTFSPALVDLFLFVLDTAEGDKMPRKRGPGHHRVRSAGHQQGRHRPVRALRPGADARRRADRCATAVRSC